MHRAWRFSIRDSDWIRISSLGFRVLASPTGWTPIACSGLFPVSSEGNKAESDQAVVAAAADGDAESEPIVSGRLSWGDTFRAFRHRNYRLFFAGMAVSLTGTWMQTAAEGWLVYDLTGSEFKLGLTRFLHSIPVTLFTLVGGHFADHFDKRRILVTTQFASMLLAFAMGALAWSGVIQFWHIAALALMLGLAQAFDIPARQSFIIELVGRKDLMNAIAMNASMFNGARVIGPAIAGLLIALPGVGIAGCFLANGLSYLAVIGSYLLMRLPPPESNPNPRSLRRGVQEALGHVRRDRVLLTLVLLVATFSLFGWPYTVLMPAIARDALGVGAGGYGMLMSANGAGALIGALTVATLGDHPRKKRIFFTGAFGFCVTILAFSRSTQVWMTAAILMAAGWFMLLFFSTANTTVQLRVPDELRGRIMGVYSLCFIGLTPFGALLAGAAARAIGAGNTLTIGAGVCATATAIAALALKGHSAAAGR